MPNTFGLNRTLGSAIGAIALVSTLSSGAVLFTLNQLHEATEAQGRSLAAIRALDGFRTAMLNQETGLRGYLITGRDSSLEPYRLGRPALDESIAQLHRLIGTDADAARLLDDAEKGARAWQTRIGEAAIRMAADPAKRPEAVKIEADGEGKSFFDAFREKLAAIERAQERARDAQTERLAQAERNATITLWVGALVTLLICAGIGIAINRLIVRPLAGVVGFVERIGAGDLTGRLVATERNEVSEVLTTKPERGNRRRDEQNNAQ